MTVRKQACGKIVFLSCAVLMLFSCTLVKAQGLHFSQYFNAPLLLNPANTALMSESDYRLGINYRNQWGRVPVPFKTFSAFGDLQAFRSRNETNWLGIGVAFFNDIAGDGNLTLTRGDVSIAYHVQTSDNFMISAGLSGGYAGRSVDFNKLSFDVQWDGFKFDKAMPNGEQDNIIKTNFYDVGAGVNLAFFPNELVYMKLGAGVAHINQPTETLYNLTNKIGIRPTLNLDAQIIIDRIWTVNPSAYYTTQQGAREIVFGSLGYARLGGKENNVTSLIIGGYYRFDEAVIGTFGLQWGGLKMMTSYDYTMSTLSPEIKGNGAFEFSLIYQGSYGENSHAGKNMNCPRF